MDQTFWQEHGDEISAAITLVVAIILIGVALALSQFASIKRFATGVLASTAVLGIIIGFAGRQVIANLVSGVLMAITQPIRIGDRITIGDEVDGRVIDIALTFTRVDGGDGQAHEAELREKAQGALRDAGLLSSP